MSIAFSIAESLLQSEALTLFVTHYPLVTTLPNLYPNVKNFHLKTSFTTAGAGGGGAALANPDEADGMVYLHTVSAGACDLKTGYGIMMAQQCGFPTEMIEDAKSIQATVKEVHPTLSNQGSSTDGEDQCAVALYTLLQHLQLLKDSTLDDMDLRVYLSNLRSKVSDEAVEQMLLYLNSDCNNAGGVASEIAVVDASD